MTSLKFEIETWASALEAYDGQDWDTALDLFSKIADTSKIYTNIGLIHAALGEHEAAVSAFHAATSLDSYLGIAYFQAGVSNFLMGRFEEALSDFEDTFQVLRGNEAINYEQLGLKYQLHGAAVLFNQGISVINMGDQERGVQLLRDAQALKAAEEHDVIDDAIRDRGDGYSVFCIPVGVLYRPNEKKIANMKARDWMGKARLISTTDSKDEFTVTRVAPPRPDPPPPQVSLGRSRSAFAPRSEVPAPRIGRSATVGATNYNARGARLDPLAMSKKPVIVSPLDPAFVLPPAPEPLTKSKSVRIANGTAAKGPPMARRPTLKVVNDDIELPPSPPQSERSGSVSSIQSNKSQRLLAAVEEEAIRIPPLQIKAKSKAIPANVPEDVDSETMIKDVYDGYMNEGDEQYFVPSPGSKQPKESFDKTIKRKGSVASGLGADSGSGPRVVRPVRSNTLPNLEVNPQNTVPVSQFSSASSSGLSHSSGSVASDVELQRIRIKLYHKDDIRGMVVPSSIVFADLLKRVCDKFECPLKTLRMKFEDEDGTKISIRDDDDWELAIGTARIGMSGVGGAAGEGKLTVWCEDA